MISFPTYNISSGMADLTIRSNALTVVIHGLVCQTSLKNAGKLPRAASRSFTVTGSGCGLEEPLEEIPLRKFIECNLSKACKLCRGNCSL